MEADKKQVLGYLRFYKKDGSEGAAFPLRAEEEYTIGCNPHVTIRLKEYKNTWKPVQCVIKVDINGFAKLITTDNAHPLKLNNKTLYGSKYLLPNDTFSVLDKKFRYENPDISKNNLMKLTSRNTPTKSAATGRKCYTDVNRKRYTDIMGEAKPEDGFQSLRGSKTPHLRRQLTYLRPAVSLKSPSPLPAAVAKAMQTPESLQQRKLNNSTEDEIAIDDLSTPPNNKSLVEINSTPFPSARKRRSLTSGADDDLESADTKTPKTHSKFRNSLHLFSGRKSSLCNTLISIPESGESKQKSFTRSSVLTRRSSKINLINEEEVCEPKLTNDDLPEQASTRKSAAKLNETFSGGDDTNSDEDFTEKQKSWFDDSVGVAAVQRQTPSTRKSAANLNGTFSEDDFSVPERKAVARKFNKTSSDADVFSVEKQRRYGAALRERRFSDFISSSQKTVTPVLKIQKSSAVENLNSPSASPCPLFIHRRTTMASTARKSLRRSTLTSENAIVVSTPSSPANNVTLRRTLRNVTSAYRLSQENIMDDDLPEQASTRKSTAKLNETFSGGDDTNSDEDFSEKQKSWFDDSVGVAAVQRQTPSTRKSAANLNRTFSEDDFSVPERKAVARKLNKTSSDADVFSVEKQRRYGAALRERRFSDFISSSQKTVTPVLKIQKSSAVENLNSPSASPCPLFIHRRTAMASTARKSLRRSTLTSENVIVVSTPSPPANNVTLRRPLRNVTSAYRLSQENIILCNSDLDHSQKSADESVDAGSQENRIAVKTLSNSMSKSLQSKSYSKVFPSPKKSGSSSKSFLSFFSHSESKSLINDVEQHGINNNNYETESTGNCSVNEGEISEESSLVKQLTLVLSDEELGADSKIQNQESSFENHDASSLLETTESSSFYYERASTANVNSTFPDLSNVSSSLRHSELESSTPASNARRILRSSKTPSDLRGLLSATDVKANKSPNLSDVAGFVKTPQEEVKSDLSDVREHKIENNSQVARLTRRMKMPRPNKSPANDLSNVAGVRKLMETPRERKQPKNDLSDVAGVRKLMRTPRDQKQPKNDLSDVAGLRKLMQTPRNRKQPKNDLSDVAGVRKLMGTPHEQKQPKNDLSDVAGLRELMETPRDRKQPKNDLSDVAGVRQLMETPRYQKQPINDLSDVAGVRKLLETPRCQKQPKNDLSDVKGVKRLMRTPKAYKSPKNDLTDVRGLKRLMSTPKVIKSPLNDLSDVRGVRDLMRSSKRKESMDLSGVKELMTTPIVSATASTSDAKSDQVLMSDFDALLNRKPIRTYKSKSPLISQLNSLITDDNVLPVQPDVAKWVEEQDDYLQSQIKQEDSNLRVTPARALRSKKKIEESKNEEVNPVIPTRSRRLPKNKQQIEESISPKREEVMLTRSRRLRAGASHLEEKGTKNTETVEEEIRNTRRGRLPKNKHVEVDPKTDSEGEETVEETRTNTRKRGGLPQSEEHVGHDPKTNGEDEQTVKETRANTRKRGGLPKSKAHVGHDSKVDGEDEQTVEEIRTSTRKRGGLPKSKVHVEHDSKADCEEEQIVGETRTNTRKRGLSKSKVHVGHDPKDDGEGEQIVEEIRTNTRKRGGLSKSKAHIGHDPKTNGEDEQTVEETRTNTRKRGRLPKSEEHVGQDPKADGEDEQTLEETRTNTRKRGRLQKNKQHVEVDGVDDQADLKGHDDDNKSQGTRPNTRSRNQTKRNELPETETREQAEAVSLRTRKRKAVPVVEEDTADEVSLKKTKKPVTFDLAVDSPRRTNRTPRKSRRIADEEFEFNIDNISVGHSKKSTRKRK